ncbi:GMC oxidoreductase [Amaricoccus macauensis]|uniref:GMC oxidoreductase n=1 Tax=Amaricoccus macauensis TaxID=57001 RepID=UPI003C7CB88B
MILDAQNADRAFFDRTFDACIVGTGPAGMSLARRLAAHGFSVALMEGGGLDITAESQELYEGDIVGLPYYPTDITRLRFLGGSSNHWGGRCRALDPYDYRAQPHHPLSGWPIGWEDLSPYAAETEAILDLPPSEATPDETVEGAEEDLFLPGFRFSYPPTMIGRKYQDEIDASDRITLVVNANLVDIRMNGNGTAVAGTVFKSYAPEDGGFTVRARSYCLCLGALENPRALLNANSQFPKGIGNQHDLVGRYFCEHPTYLVGEVLFEDRVPPKTGFAPTPEFMQRAGCLNFNALLNTHALHLKTEAMRSVACTSDFMTELAERVLGRPFKCDVGGIARYFDALKTDEFHKGEIGCIAEQALNRDSRVLLSDTKDRFGLQRLAIDWRHSPLDFQTYRACVTVMGEYLAKEHIGRVKVADWLMDEDPTPPEMGTPGHQVGAHHHMCTTRMSENPREGVVDANCRVHGVGNLFMGGSSVFATAGHCNPTYTIVELALRLGDHLSEELAGGNLASVSDDSVIR